VSTSIKCVATLLVCVAACKYDPREQPKKGSAAVGSAQSASPPTTDDAAAVESTSTSVLDDRFLAALARATKRAPEGMAIRVGEHKIRLATTVENDGKMDTGYAVGIAVRLVLDDSPVVKLTTGAVGIGTDRNDALAKAADDWAMQYGRPIVAAYEGKAPSFEAVDMKIYAGPVGFRGTPPAANQDLARPAFDALAPALRVIVAQDDGLHGLTITMTRDANGVDGEVRFDGEHHIALSTDARRATWPDGHYMVKLFYVMMR